MNKSQVTKMLNAGYDPVLLSIEKWLGNKTSLFPSLLADSCAMYIDATSQSDTETGRCLHCQYYRQYEKYCWNETYGEATFTWSHGLRDRYQSAVDNLIEELIGLRAVAYKVVADRCSVIAGGQYKTRYPFGMVVKTKYPMFCFSDKGRAQDFIDSLPPIHTRNVRKFEVLRCCVVKSARRRHQVVCPGWVNNVSSGMVKRYWEHCHTEYYYPPIPTYTVLADQLIPLV